MTLITLPNPADPDCLEKGKGRKKVVVDKKESAFLPFPFPFPFPFPPSRSVTGNDDVDDYVDVDDDDDIDNENDNNNSNNNDNDNVRSPACVCCPGESSGPSLASRSLDRVSLGLAR